VRTTRGERDLKVDDGCEAKVEAIGSLPSVLHGDFTLILNNVLYVLLLQRNLISMSLLEDDGYECLFGNNKWIIMFIDKVGDIKNCHTHN
jgi:hypothetical protein